jgi:transposase
MRGEVVDVRYGVAPIAFSYPAATAEAWVDGHVHAFAFFKYCGLLQGSSADLASCQIELRDQLRRLKTGLFSPPVREPTIVGPRLYAILLVRSTF